MFSNKKTYTIHEFLEMQREERNLDKETKALEVGLGCTLFLMNNPCIALAADANGIDALGNTFLGIIQRVGYWIALIAAIGEIIKVAMKGGTGSDIGKVILKYVLIYASLFLMPWLFDQVAKAF